MVIMIWERKPELQKGDKKKVSRTFRPGIGPLVV